MDKKKFTIQLRGSGSVYGDQGLYWLWEPCVLYGTKQDGWWEGHHPFVMVTMRRGRVVVSAPSKWNLPEEFLRKIQREFELDWRLAAAKYLAM